MDRSDRVITLLEQEVLLTRDDKKCVLTVAWPELLSRWAKGYDLTQSNGQKNFELGGFFALQFRAQCYREAPKYRDEK